MSITFRHGMRGDQPGYAAPMADERDPHKEPDNSTVDDWHGQEVDRLMEKADEALAAEEGDETKAEARFNDETKD
jgi:hypothetical protein